ncbi:MAG: CotH kinase family protein [Crocinitomicaceae bacterium]
MNRIFFIALCLILFSCEKEEEKKPFWVERIFSSFEQFDSRNDNNRFLTENDTVFINTKLDQSNQYSFSNQYSAKINPRQSELIYQYSHCKKGQLIEFTIWEKKNKNTSKVNLNLYAKDSIISLFSIINDESRKKRGWRQHHIEVPLNIDIDSFDIKINNGIDTSYIDDFKLYIYPVKSTNNLTGRLNLYIPSKSKLKLNSYLNFAIPERIIPGKSKKYIKAYWINLNDTLPLKFKIKGDWTDHVQPHKPSLRIKLKNSAFNNLSTFSIQDVSTRSFVNEWILHELASYIDVLTTDYSFLNVAINGYNYGLYAIEEHFTKRLLESKKRREGPILKMQEDSYWNLMKSRLSGETSGAFPFYESSMISAFGLNRIRKNITLKKQYIEGAKLLAKFKNGDTDIENIFDIDKLAKYYVLIEFSGSAHGNSWHNRRFYFNPITQKLEHIFYDAIPNPKSTKSYMVEVLNKRDVETFESLDYAILRNEQFKESYMSYLQLYTDSIFLNGFKNHIQKDYDLYYSSIQKEYPNYNHDLNIILKKGKLLNQDRSDLLKLWNETIKNATSNELWVNNRSYSEKSVPTYIKNIELNTYSTGDSVNGYHLTLENFHSNVLTVISLFNANKVEKFDNVKLKGYSDQFDSKELHVNFKPDSISYLLENVPGKVFKQKINPFRKPQGATTLMKAEKKWDPSKFQITDNIITLSGIVLIEEVILIPSKFEVNILPGSQIRFKNGGGLIVNNKVTAIGKIENPIQITSLDSNSNGFTVINGGQFILENAQITGLNSLSYENWTLTGAITIYETPCKLKNVTISNNFCEDALNIIRSHFEIENLSINNTYSDGFDADFCTGTFRRSKFNNTGNDCIDFSGSKVEIEDIEIINSGDKGVSAGEASELYLKNINIDGAISGIASKDGSSVFGENISIKNAQTGLIAFQKKLDYSPAKMTIKESTIVSTNENVITEKGSEIIWNENVFHSSEILNIEEMYSIFTKK